MTNRTQTGLATLVVPMYISEISPTNQRGTLGVLNQVGITSGIFISQVIALQDVPVCHEIKQS